MSKLNCIIHYADLPPYSEIKPLSDVNIRRIEEAKEKRIKLGGLNHHQEQIVQIPEKIDALRHGIHLDPCYKRFTLVIGDKRHQETHEDQSRKSRRLSSPEPKQERDTFPRECQICGKYQKQHRNKKHYPHKILTYNAEATVKNATQAKNPLHFLEIKDIDLIAKDYKVHEPCYQSFTRGFTEASLEATATSSSSCPNEEEDDQSYIKSNFEEVKEYVRDVIIGEQRATSMKLLHEIDGLGVGDTRYRSKLKKRLVNEFGDKISFLKSHQNNYPEVVISTEELSSTSFHHDSNLIVNRAAKLLQKEILEKFKDCPDTSWPPTADELQSEKFKPPELVLSFVKNLLTTTDRKSRSTKIDRISASIAQDIVFNCCKGKTLQLKHFLLALGLHNLTGSRKVVDIVHRLGHCMDYNSVCDIETAQAELVQEEASKTTILPVRPDADDSTVYTHFWVDNFDVNVDRQVGGGSIHTTHLMAFQKGRAIRGERNTTEPMPRRRSRKIFLEDVHVSSISVDRKKNPPQIFSNENFEFEAVEFNKKYLLWAFLRKQFSSQQCIPVFKGWKLKTRIDDNLVLEKTTETYLPPINAKVTEFSTIKQYMEYCQKLAADMNMPYVNITLDVGAAMNAYLLIWNEPEKFQNIIIHLGSFHFLKENYQVLGAMVRDSGFEDVIYASNICSSGSLQGVLAGSHYNRACFVHGTFSEALERLLLTRFLVEKKPEMSAALQSLNDVKFDPDKMSPLLENEFGELFAKYDTYRDDMRCGKVGKTSQFWSLYLDLMRFQTMAHTAVQENDIKSLMFCWKQFLPLYFVLNKLHYARYGSYYYETMMHLDKAFPGMGDLISENGLSVQAQEKHPLMTAADQRGEQTINKDAKTLGGIKGFASNTMNVLKWCLNRPKQAAVMKELFEISGMSTKSYDYKALREKEVARSEINVQRIIEILENNFLNPFGLEVDEESLFNLSSGLEYQGDEEALVSIYSQGEQIYEDFKKERIYSTTKPFHDRIPRVKPALFSDTSIQKEKKNQKAEVIKANRNVLGKLLTISTVAQEPIDFNQALAYPLYHVPLSLAYPDGSKRSNQKSKLLEILLENKINIPSIESREASTLIIDMIAHYRVISKNLPQTFEEWILRFLRKIPSGYQRVDIVADTYRMFSIKAGERKKRGSSSRLLIKSAKLKTPQNTLKFFSNNDNKNALIALTFNYIKENPVKCLEILKCEVIILSGDNYCERVTKLTCESFEELKSDQEEADTKVVLHALQVIRSSGSNVCIRSPSGDTDIFVIALGMIEERSRVKFDYGNGTDRKEIWLDEIKLQDNLYKALIGFHAFTGNDYVPALFKKGKARCWEIMIKDPKFVNMFSCLGCEWDLNSEMQSDLEHYVCKLYSSKKKSVNDVRFQLFERKQKKGVVVDLCNIPPCKPSLLLQMDRGNYVARIWKTTDLAMQNAPSPAGYGWDQDGDIQWVEEVLPEDITTLLLRMEDDSDSESECYGDEDSDMEMESDFEE